LEGGRRSIGELASGINLAIVSWPASGGKEGKGKGPP